MKKWCFLLFLGLNASLLTAQDDIPGSIIKTNPFGLAFGNFNLAYEKVLSESSSVIVKAKYTYKFLGLKVNVAGFGKVLSHYYVINNNYFTPDGVLSRCQLSFCKLQQVACGRYSAHSN